MKYIILEVVKVSEEYIYFKIKDQSHRGREFGENGRLFNYGNISLRSSNVPELTTPTSRVLYVRGNLVGGDNDILKAEINTFNELCDAIKAYNTINGYSGEYICGITPRECKQTCGAVMCPKCLERVKENITFSFVNEQKMFHILTRDEDTEFMSELFHIYQSWSGIGGG